MNTDNKDQDPIEELFEKYDNDYELFPLPIEMDPVEERKAMQAREKEIREHIKWVTAKNNDIQ